MTGAQQPSASAPPPPGAPSAAAPQPLTHQQRIALFGRFPFEFAAMPGDPERIRITNDWAARNIVAVPLPKIGPGLLKHAQVHRLIARQFAAFWDEIQSAGLLPRVLTFDGAFCARFKRGRASPFAGADQLSNHSWGSAFDVNAPWNHLGTSGADAGTPGSTHELDAIALKHGFLNGRMFHAPWQDPMHFEAFKIAT